MRGNRIYSITDEFESVLEEVTEMVNVDNF